MSAAGTVIEFLDLGRLHADLAQRLETAWRSVLVSGRLWAAPRSRHSRRSSRATARRPVAWVGLLEQLARLRRWGWTPLDLDGYMAALDGAPVPRRSFLLTIDDGHVSVLDVVAAPEAAGVPSVLFVCPGLLGDEQLARTITDPSPRPGAGYSTAPPPNAVGDTWRNLRHELDRMALITLATEHGRAAQRSALTTGHKTILTALDQPEPARYFDFTTTGD